MGNRDRRGNSTITEDLPVQCELFPEETQRDHRELMAHPFAAFSKDLNEITYRRQYSSGRTVELEVTSSSTYGMATIHDFDVVLYVISVIREAMNRGEEPPRTVTFTPRQLLKWSDRSTSGRGYDHLYNALERLATTSVKTTVMQQESRRENLEPWLAWTIHLREDGETLQRNDQITIRLNSWLWKSVAEHEFVLAIDREYFSLRSSYERFLYRVFRKSVGQDNFWGWKMNTLYQKAGTNVKFAHFAYKIRQRAERDNLPRYRLSVLEEESGSEWVRAYDRDFWQACLRGEKQVPKKPWEIGH
ncbi:replication initiator protein A [Salinibacter ruber]|uniref:replication initiator protein A n=1 Tax=Salinibacter ruber TaxID=146919 RepID=UPI002168B455|nr:replication initiator protein A [Salinibacter ruber]